MPTAASRAYATLIPDVEHKKRLFRNVREPDQNNNGDTNKSDTK